MTGLATDDTLKAVTLLSVNVNKLATLRNARGKNSPNVEQVSQDILNYGAHGLTVHPRPDGRHIRPRDVHVLSDLIKDYRDSQRKVEFNVEGYPSTEFLQLMSVVQPDQCTLVPDPPDVLTSNAGWPLAAQRKLLEPICAQLKDQGIRVSLFVDPYNLTDLDLKALETIGPHRLELYTEAYAEAFDSGEFEGTLKVFREAADRLLALGFELNAGHDLNVDNLTPLLKHIPEIKEVSIGHALICEALKLGMSTAVKNYLDLLAQVAQTPENS